VILGRGVSLDGAPEYFDAFAHLALGDEPVGFVAQRGTVFDAALGRRS
jgi:hypothetical protein